MNIEMSAISMMISLVAYTNPPLINDSCAIKTITVKNAIITSIAYYPYGNENKMNIQTVPVFSEREKNPKSIIGR